MPAVGPDGTFEELDGRVRLAQQVGATSSQPGQPDGHHRVEPARHLVGEAGEIAHSSTAPSALLPGRFGHGAVLQDAGQQDRRRLTLAVRPAQRLGAVGGERLARPDDQHQPLDPFVVEAVADRQTVAGLPGVQRLPVEALLGDDPVPLDQPGGGVQRRQRRDRRSNERGTIGDQRLVHRVVADGEPHLGRRRAIRGLAGLGSQRTLEAGADRGDLRIVASGERLAHRPPQGTGHDLDRRPPTSQIREPAVGTDHHVGVAAVEPPPVRLQHAKAFAGLADELDLVADQPPPHRRQVGMHPDEALSGVVSVDPDGPRRPLQEARQVDDAVVHLTEGRVGLQQAAHATPIGTEVDVARQERIHELLAQ